MSFSFYLRAVSPPRFSEVVDAMRDRDWRCDGPEDDRFAEGLFVHPYVEGRSTRGVELGLEEGSMRVRILTCSSPADYDLAVRLVDTLARMLKTPIVPEDGEEMSREEFRLTYDEGWIDGMVASGPEIIRSFLRQRGGPLTMMGAKRPFHVGMRLLAELTAGGDAGFGERFIDAMVKVQHVDEEVYHAASVFLVKPKGAAPPNDEVKVGAWAADVAYIFPDVAYFALVVPTGGHLLVPSAAGPAVAGPRWTFLDEKQALVEATPAAEWPALLDRARPLATQLPT